MIARDMTFAEAREKADAFRQVGVEEIYLRAEASDLPWDRVSRIETGGAWRMRTPTGIRLTAHIDGHTFVWNVDLESRNANGASTHLIDRNNVRDIALKLPSEMRPALLSILSEQFLPPISETTREYRAELARQWDSEDCVRGVIAFLEEQVAADQAEAEGGDNA